MQEEFQEYEGITLVECSSVNGEGMEELRDIIVSCIEDDIEETEKE